MSQNMAQDGYIFVPEKSINNRAMGSILKFFAILLLIGVVLVFLIPIAWLVIKLFTWLFGGMAFMIGDILLFVFIVAVVILIIKAIFN